MKPMTDITKEIKKLYDIDDIKFDATSKLLIIIDRCGVSSDMMYIFPENGTDCPELNKNYFIEFSHAIINSNGVNSVISHLRYGINCRIRFFPELLTRFIPRLFVRHNDISEAKFLDKIYDVSFKNGWSVDLQDDMFSTTYKIVTGYTHCSVNVNRFALHKEINNAVPMLCFLQILFTELSENIKAGDIQDFAQYVADNEYDSESVIYDIEMNNQSNIRKHYESKKTRELFMVVRDVVTKFRQPAQVHLHSSECGGGDEEKAFDFPDCSYISTIITALKQYSKDFT
eukprot:494712_1